MLIVLELLFYSFQTRAGHAVEAGLRERHPPVDRGLAMADRFAPVAEVDGEIRDHGVIVDEEILDRLALVAEAQDEILESVGRVAAHDEPKDRIATDRDHGLGQIVGDPANAGPLPSAQDDGLHPNRPLALCLARAVQNSAFADTRLPAMNARAPSIAPRRASESFNSETICRLNSSGDRHFGVCALAIGSVSSMMSEPTKTAGTPAIAASNPALDAL